MRLPGLDPPTPQWRAAIKRFGELLVVYGHGLLAFGVGKAFAGALDVAAAVRWHGALRF